MKKIILVPFALLLFSCNGSKSTKDATSRPVTEARQSAKLYTVLSESVYQGKDSKSYEIIKDNESLITLYQSVNDEQIPRIDFTKEKIIALFSGQKNSGGYAIKVVDVIEKGGKIYVTVQETAPKSGENATMAMTNPYTIVKINSTKEIVFK